MDISSMLSNNEGESNQARGMREPPRPKGHPYSTRHRNPAHPTAEMPQYPTLPAYQSVQYSHQDQTQGVTPTTVSPSRPGEKNVQFRLILANNTRDRLPLRVTIRKHDTVESIVGTVKNFWGLVHGQGVSFEDPRGLTLIAQYENLSHDETCYVRVRGYDPATADHSYRYDAAHGPPLEQRPQLGEPFQMSAPQNLSRPSSSFVKKRDASPPSAPGQRSLSVRSMSRIQPGDAENSDSDGGSMTSSRRARSEQVNAEISMQNIVEGGRRKRAKFESSALPLFAPPQQAVPASMSSMSPQRRQINGNFQSPINPNTQATFSYNYQSMAYSPKTYNYNGLATPHTGSIASGHANAPQHQSEHQLRTSSSRVPLRSSYGSATNVLPTPDPTVNSVISDEDVALQLMRLGDASNLSHGRNSNSTLDDALSGKAEVASSEGNTEDGSEEEERPLPTAKHSHASGPARKKAKGTNGLPASYGDYTSGEEYEDKKDASFKGDSDGIAPSGHGTATTTSKHKLIKPKSRTNSTGSKARPPKSKSKSTSTKIPPSPYSADSESQKNSTASANVFHNAGIDEDDLSTKPRCQRCRKSKKGCDRQRPCQRCKDAGIGAEGCISEDEGNGRKGRFGRHMGVAVAKDEATAMLAPSQAATSFSTEIYSGDASIAIAEASKKRKR